MCEVCAYFKYGTKEKRIQKWVFVVVLITCYYYTCIYDLLLLMAEIFEEVKGTTK